MALHQVPRHRVHPLAGELVIVAVGAARVGEALQLHYRVGIGQQRLGHVLDLVDPLVPQRRLVEVEIDGLRLDEGELVAIGHPRVQRRQAGIRVVMATGDGPTTAQAVARKLGIDEVYGEVRPQDKADLVARLQGEGRRVAMAGDGIAMGTGTDVAMQSAQVTLVKGDLRGIVRARQVSEATVRNMYQNLLFALIYNALGVPIAAGVLYPFFGILLSPLIAAAAMSFSSVSVVSNALRLRSA